MSGAIDALSDGQGFLEQGFGAGVPAQLTIHFAQLTQRFGETLALRIQHFRFFARRHKGFFRMRIVARPHRVIAVVHSRTPAMVFRATGEGSQ